MAGLQIRKKYVNSQHNSMENLGYEADNGCGE